MKILTRCTIPNCTNIEHGRTWCTTHYRRYRLYGDPLIVREHHRPRAMSELDWFWERINKNGSVPDHCPELGPCMEWTGLRTKQGYGKLGITREGKYLTVITHRYSFILAYGPLPPDKPYACHKCDNRPCVRPDHLFAGTALDNRRDCLHKNRQAGGETSGTSKLTEDMVRSIRAQHVRGVKPSNMLGNFNNVALNTIISAALHRTWKHVV